MEKIDEIDWRILAILQQDGRISITDLAQQVELTPPTVQRRVKLLEEAGLIKGYVAVLEPLKLSLPVTAFILIETMAGCALEQVRHDLHMLHGVQEVHNLIGEWCILLKVRTTSPQMLEDLLNRQIRRVDGVRRTQTILSTSSPYETTCLPLPERD